MEEHIFGKNLKYYRKSLGITQKQLGILTDVGQGSIANYERGLRFPGESTLRKIAEVLNVPLNQLLSVNSSKALLNDGIEYNPFSFMEILLNESFQRAWQYVRGWGSSAQFSIMDIYSKILIPVLIETGKSWFIGDLSISEEHLISWKVRELIVLAAKEELEKEENLLNSGKIWMGLTAPSEEHYLTLLMSSQLLKLKGWKVIYLGTGIPLADLKQSIRKFSPDILCFAVTMKSNLPGLEAYLESLQNYRSKNMRIIIGGNVFPVEKVKKYPKILGLARSLEEGINLVMGEQ